MPSTAAKATRRSAKCSVFYPAQRPFCFFLYGRHRIDGVKQAVFFLRVFHIRINQQRVGFRMDVFHHDLETIETARFGQLHFTHEVHCEVFVHNAIACGKKCQHMRDKMTLAIVQA